MISKPIFKVSETLTVHLKQSKGPSPSTAVNLFNSQSEGGIFGGARISLQCDDTVIGIFGQKVANVDVLSLILIGSTQRRQSETGILSIGRSD